MATEIYEIMVSTFPIVPFKKYPKNRPLLEILEEIRTGSSSIFKKEMNVRQLVKDIRNETDKTRRGALKSLLPVFTPSGTFTERKDDCLSVFNGIFCLDLDHVQKPKEEMERLKQYPFILSVFPSPTDGLKILILTDLPQSDISRFRDVYHFLGHILGLKGRSDLEFDGKCSNISRSCFWSYAGFNFYLNKKTEPYHILLDEVPVYNPPKEAKQNNSTRHASSTGLVTLEDISKAIIQTHEQFEKYYFMYPGTRNTNLYILAHFMEEAGVPEDSAMDYLVAYYADEANGFSVEEIKRTIKSSYNEE